MSKTKINIASYRVFRTLQSLFESDMSMNEIVDKLNSELENPQSTKYNNFVVSKYLNTCKCCGIDIQKIDGDYALMNFPFGEKFTQEEAQLIFELISCEENKKTKKIDNKLITKLHLPLYKSSNGLKSNESYRIIKLFERALTANLDITCIFRNGEKIICSPEDIKAEDDKIILTVSENNKKRKINTNELADIKPNDKKIRKTKIETNEVIFELKEKLAKRYQLRPNEQLLRIKPNGSFVIVNKFEDKSTLLRRLMRYDYLCKVVRPQEYVDEMKSMINDTLKNYGI